MTNSDNKKSRDVLYKEFNNCKAFFRANFFSLIERQCNACTRSLTYNEVECWAILYQAKIMQIRMLITRFYTTH